ncbi:MAG: DUF1801 domain-containing protein [Pseudomonadota bacterium]
MQYPVNTPDEYLDALEADWRKDTLGRIRQLIQQAGPDLVERMNYKMLAFGSDDDAIFHLNAQKHYVSLYVGNAKRVDPSGELLQGLNVGKGCIRFSKTVDVDETRIDEFIDRAVQQWQQGEDIDC